MNAFSDEYAKFIEKLCSYLKHSSESTKMFISDIDGIDFSEKIDEIEKEAKSEYAQTVIAFASSQIDPSSRDHLLWEMKLFNNSPDPIDIEADDDYDQKYKDVLNAGESVKGSLEHFLKQWLPNWLQKVLKILNQIISILKS